LGTSFQQGNGANAEQQNNVNNKSGADRVGMQEGVMKGSIFAGIVAVVAMMAM
jgi:hypothetical protein